MQAGLVVPLEKGTGNLFIAAERPKGANSRIHHFLPQCITFNQSALRHEQLKEKHGEVRWVRVHRSLLRLRVFFVANFLEHG